METEHITIKAARELATRMHTRQSYGPHPYTYHLARVAEIVSTTSGGDADLVAAAWMHDIVEDTVTRVSEIKNQFGVKISDLVYFVTNEIGRNRKEKTLKTLLKVRGAGQAATLIKLADRIANTTFSLSQKSNGGTHYDMYRKEYPFFRYSLMVPAHGLETLWKDLDCLSCYSD